MRKYRVWDGVKRAFFPLNDKLHALRTDGSLMNGDRYSVVQFWTGITDINSIEIFEGDVVKAANDLYYTVKFGPYHDVDSIRASYGWYMEGEGWKWHLSAEDGVEVVGNIFYPPNPVVTQ